MLPSSRRPPVPRLALALALLGAAAAPAAAQGGGADAAAFARAAENARAANEALDRSDRLMRDWLTLADPVSGLLPRNTTDSRDVWNAKDTAADLYPFLVLTAWFTDPALYEGRMQEILLTETALTSRVGRLPDTWSFSKQGFATEQPDLPGILFGASEYVKDALMNVTELLGATPWRARMIGLVDDAWRHAPVETPHGRIVSTDPEVNGDMLLVLGRLYWMTRDPKYLEYAVRLGDYYLLGDHHPTRDFATLRLRDHGNEVVSGLTELYATLKQVQPQKAAAYRAPIHEMLDRILEVGRNADGLFYNVIDPRAGKATDAKIADNFGYVLNGVYTVYLLDGTPAYREAVRKALGALNGGYRGYDWENRGQDGDADAIEGALYLYNREPVPSAAEWIDYQTRWMWSKQDSAHRPNTERWRGRGVVEGGYADGNFNRTSLMYALWKSQGTSVHPWRKEVRHGAVRRGDALLLSVAADAAWAGDLRFDVPRHRLLLGMPADWPRINSYPEWFTVEPERRYEVRDAATGAASVHTGAELRRGLPLRLAAGEERRLVVTPLAGPVGLAELRALPKIDVHSHYESDDPALVPTLDAWKLRSVLVNVLSDGRLEEKGANMRALAAKHPERFFLVTTFDPARIDEPDFAASTLARLRADLDAGARGVKVWKTIGMEIRDRRGRYVQIDDPRFQPIWDYLAGRGVPVIAHIGEPIDAWRPLDPQSPHYGYYSTHPQYHAYRHPEIPRFETIIAARDRWLERNPRLVVIGAHLASLAHDVDEVARRLDRFPNLHVEMAARINNLAMQPADKVRDFLIRYQDRVMYGTDFGESSFSRERLENGYRQHFGYLMGAEPVDFGRPDAWHVRTPGLALPRAVLEKIAHRNAERVLGLPPARPGG